MYPPRSLISGRCQSNETGACLRSPQWPTVTVVGRSTTFNQIPQYFGGIPRYCIGIPRCYGEVPQYLVEFRQIWLEFLFLKEFCFILAEIWFLMGGNLLYMAKFCFILTEFNSLEFRKTLRIDFTDIIQTVNGRCKRWPHNV